MDTKNWTLLIFFDKKLILWYYLYVARNLAYNKKEEHSISQVNAYLKIIDWTLILAE